MSEDAGKYAVGDDIGAQGEYEDEDDDEDDDDDADVNVGLRDD